MLAHLKSSGQKYATTTNQFRQIENFISRLIAAEMGKLPFREKPWRSKESTSSSNLMEVGKSQSSIKNGAKTERKKMMQSNETSQIGR